MTFRVPSRMNPAFRPLALSLGLTAAILAGCTTYQPGGDGVSKDAQTYWSTSHEPKTMQLKDTRTGEVLWTYEIPPDRELVVRFYAGRNADNPEMPDEMRWEEWEIGRRFGSLEQKMPVPSERYRRLDQYVRKAEPTPAKAASAQ